MISLLGRINTHLHASTKQLPQSEYSSSPFGGVGPRCSARILSLRALSHTLKAFLHSSFRKSALPQPQSMNIFRSSLRTVSRFLLYIPVNASELTAGTFEAVPILFWLNISPLSLPSLSWTGIHSKEVYFSSQSLKNSLMGVEGKCFQTSPASQSDCGHILWMPPLIPPNSEKSLIVPITDQS